MTIEKLNASYWRHNETNSVISLFEGGYVLGTADFLEMCGCTEASINHPQFDVDASDDEDYDADEAALDLLYAWERCQVARYLAARGDWLYQHEAQTGVRCARAYKDVADGPIHLHLLHMSVMLDFAAWCGHPAPADVVAAFSEVQ